jgi:hypothetical protein
MKKLIVLLFLTCMGCNKAHNPIQGGLLTPEVDSIQSTTIVQSSSFVDPSLSPPKLSAYEKAVDVAYQIERAVVYNIALSAATLYARYPNMTWQQVGQLAEFFLEVYMTTVSVRSAIECIPLLYRHARGLDKEIN